MPTETLFPTPKNSPRDRTLLLIAPAFVLTFSPVVFLKRLKKDPFSLNNNATEDAVKIKPPVNWRKGFISTTFSQTFLNLEGGVSGGVVSCFVLGSGTGVGTGSDFGWGSILL